MTDEMSMIEKEIQRRLPIGWSTSYLIVVHKFVTQHDYSSDALRRTLPMLEKIEVIRFSKLGEIRVRHAKVDR